MKGLLWGTTSLQISNSMIFIDRENSLKAHITFEAKDEMKGSIYKYDPAKV
jgi:hypothetical protein